MTNSVTVEISNKIIYLYKNEKEYIECNFFDIPFVLNNNLNLINKKLLNKLNDYFFNLYFDFLSEL